MATQGKAVVKACKADQEPYMIFGCLPFTCTSKVSKLGYEVYLGRFFGFGMFFFLFHGPWDLSFNLPQLLVKNSWQFHRIWGLRPPSAWIAGMWKLPVFMVMKVPPRWRSAKNLWRLIHWKVVVLSSAPWQCIRRGVVAHEVWFSREVFGGRFSVQV